jgi:hypothetical protein
VSAQRAITAGWRSMSPFQTARALSYSTSEAVITWPLNELRNADSGESRT